MMEFPTKGVILFQSEVYAAQRAHSTNKRHKSLLKMSSYIKKYSTKSNNWRKSFRKFSTT